MLREQIERMPIPSASAARFKVLKDLGTSESPPADVFEAENLQTLSVLTRGIGIPGVTYNEIGKGGQKDKPQEKKYQVKNVGGKWVAYEGEGELSPKDVKKITGKNAKDITVKPFKVPQYKSKDPEPKYDDDRTPGRDL